MNYEAYFVKQFIVRSRRDRLLYELQSRRKRRDGIGRFCHDTENLIDNSKLIVSGSHLTAYDFEKCLGNRKCYVIAYHAELDGLSCYLREALEKVLDNGMAAVIIGEDFAIIETEQEQGSAVKYLLKEKTSGI